MPRIEPDLGGENGARSSPLPCSLRHVVICHRGAKQSEPSTWRGAGRHSDSGSSACRGDPLWRLGFHGAHETQVLTGGAAAAAMRIGFYREVGSGMVDQPIDLPWR